jgi:hypothetical protein
MQMCSVTGSRTGHLFLPAATSLIPPFLPLSPSQPLSRLMNMRGCVEYVATMGRRATRIGNASHSHPHVLVLWRSDRRRRCRLFFDASTSSSSRERMPRSRSVWGKERESSISQCRNRHLSSVVRGYLKPTYFLWSCR